MVEVFKENSKQDDLADSLLMTLHYFEKANLMKINTDSKKAEAKKEKISKKEVKSKAKKEDKNKSNVE